MGCDIHAYIEYEYNTCPKTWLEGEEYIFGDVAGLIEVSLGWMETEVPECGNQVVVRQFCEPEFGREYSLFGLMAGVRDDRLEGYSPRGLPDHVSRKTLYEYTLRVDDHAYENYEGRYCTRKQAERWTTPSGRWPPSSVWMNEEHTLVSGPDWHIASWLTPEEFEDCLEQFNAQYREDVEPHCWGILGAMRALEEQGCVVRLVFWFDN